MRMHNMQKKVVLLSNANKVFPQNKLNCFQNCLPIDFLETHLQWSAAVESACVDLKVKNSAASKQIHFPSLITATLEELDSEKIDINENRLFTIKNFTDRQSFFIEDQEDYDAESLNYKFRWRSYNFAKINPALFCGFPLRLIENNNIQFGQFENPYEHIESKKYVLFFNEYFLQALDLTNKEKLSECFIDGEKYRFMINSPSAPVLKSRSKCKGLKIRYPRIIHICSNKIESDMNNKNQIMKSFSVYQNEQGRYVTKLFKSSEYHSLICEDISSFDIFFTDEFGNLIRLVDGTPSIVKIHFKPLEMYSLSRVTISVDSLQEHFIHQNLPHSFKSTLARELDLSVGRYKCGVSSVTYKNDFSMLSGYNLDFYVTNISDSTDEEKFFIPKHLKTNEDIRKHFFETIKHVASFDLDENDHYRLKFTKSSTLKIGKSLARCLGSTSNQEFLEIGKEKDDTYAFPSRAQNINFQPPIMFIYSDIVSHSIVGEEFCQLLKICPIEPSKTGEYVTYEFDEIEFLDCPNTNIKEISFEIKSHHGQFLEFEGDSAVFLNLVFQRVE